jgi:O-antigen/teichoic acid export membrane protein
MINIFSLSSFKNFFLKNKTLKQTVFKNTFWLFAAEVFETGIGFLIVVWLARHFGPVIYGQWSFAFSFVAIFGTIADFGLNIILIREIARYKEKASQYIDNILFIKVFLGIISFGSIAISAQFFRNEQIVYSLLFTLGIYIVINTFASFFQAVFRANEKMEYEALSRALQSVIRLAFVVFFILGGYSIIYIAYAHIIYVVMGILISALLAWYYFAKFFKKIDLQICKEVLKEAWPIALSSMIGAFYHRIGMAILYLLKDDQSVGFYNAAFGLVYSITIIPSFTLISIFPVFSKLYKESVVRLIEIYNRFTKVILISAAFIFPVLFLFSKWIIIIFYGSSYENSILAFKILLLAEFFPFIGCVFYPLLNSINRQIVFTKVHAISMILHIILCFIFIPKYSYAGLSVALVIAECFAFALLFFSVNKEFKKLI